MLDDDPEYTSSLAERDADDLQRESWELEAERYADANCTDDKAVLSRWIMGNADDAFLYMEIAKRENIGSPYGLFELLEAAYWLKLYDKKLKELQDGE